MGVFVGRVEQWLWSLFILSEYDAGYFVGCLLFEEEVDGIALRGLTFVFYFINLGWVGSIELHCSVSFHYLKIAEIISQRESGHQNEDCYWC